MWLLRLPRPISEMGIKPQAATRTILAMCLGLSLAACQAKSNGSGDAAPGPTVAAPSPSPSPLTPPRPELGAAPLSGSFRVTYRLLSANVTGAVKLEKRLWELTPLCEEGPCDARLKSYVIRKNNEARKKPAWKSTALLTKGRYKSTAHSRVAQPTSPHTMSTSFARRILSWWTTTGSSPGSRER